MLSLSLQEDSDLELKPGEEYRPIFPEPTSEPTARHPHQPAKFQVMDTPYVQHLRWERTALYNTVQPKRNAQTKFSYNQFANLVAFS